MEKNIMCLVEKFFKVEVCSWPPGGTLVDEVWEKSGAVVWVETLPK